jgi:hypothetical protein
MLHVAQCAYVWIDGPARRHNGTPCGTTVHVFADCFQVGCAGPACAGKQCTRSGVEKKKSVVMDLLAALSAQQHCCLLVGWLAS